MSEDKFLKHHKIILNDENINTTELGKQRRIMAHTHLNACKTLDNANTCRLLKENLQQYSKLFKNNLETFKSKVAENIAQSPLNKEADFKIDFNPDEILKSIKPLGCKGSTIKCSESENISGFEFCEFFDLFRKPEIENKKLPVTNMKKPISEKAPVRPQNSFKTAREELHIQNLKKNPGGNQYSSSLNSGVQKKKLGTRRNINSKFVSPLLSNNDCEESKSSDNEWPPDTNDKLKNIEPKMVELIKAEIMDSGPSIDWDDIAGLQVAKNSIKEAIVWPMLRPDIFTGLRSPPKGILLYGPPGTGKTLIGKCVASQSKSTFFSISASSLTSKWIGEGEKMVRALFMVARVHQPAVIFIDEIDSLLSQRSETEHESSRRLKTEFLVQLDGATTESEERILVIGATNRPQELDDAARRRFVKRLYIPLPDFDARLQLVTRLIEKVRHELNTIDFKTIAEMSDGYSGSDIRNLCSEASLGPIRSLDMSLIEKIKASEVRPLIMEDFENAFSRVRSSVSPNDLEQYTIWDNKYGSL